MDQIDLPMTGQCRCGATGIEVTTAPVMTAACHCTGCQRMSASAYSLTAMFPADGFRVIRGAPARCGKAGDEISHYGCPDCMSWIFTRITGVDGFVNVRPTMFDTTGWFHPFIETMTREKLPWATVPAPHSFEGFPEMEEFMTLLEEFQRAN